MFVPVPSSDRPTLPLYYVINRPINVLYNTKNAKLVTIYLNEIFRVICFHAYFSCVGYLILNMTFIRLRADATISLTLQAIFKVVQSLF